jgi:N-methylhydantoinase B/oxoprolinase/acetone carboxylase alpha subunit
MGDPKARDPELEKRDVADGLITAHAARDIYGVEVK